MVSLKKINICDIFVGLWALYYLQGLLYPQGIINQAIQMIMILIGLSSLFECCKKYSNAPYIIKASLLLVIMYFIYGFIIILFGDGIPWTTNSTYLKNSLNSLLPIFFFYIQTSNGRLTDDRIKIYTLVILIVAIAFFNFLNKQLLLKYDTDETTNNAGYLFTGMLPLIYFFNKKTIVQYVLLAIMMLYIFLGMKRGAILVGAVAVLVFLYSGLKERNRKKKFIVFLFSAVIVIGTIYYVNYLMINDDYFMARVNKTLEGNSSGRDRIYSSVWNAIVGETSVFYILFGHGANSTIKYAGNFAHQDWLETACNNGILGTIILANFFIALTFTVARGRKFFKPHYYYCALTTLASSFLTTLFSMSVQDFGIYQGLLIGYFAFWTSKKGLMTLRTFSAKSI